MWKSKSNQKAKKVISKEVCYICGAEAEGIIETLFLCTEHFKEAQRRVIEEWELNNV